MVDIPDGFKGLVIGKGGENLNKISTRTGAHVFRKGWDVFMSGSEEAKEKVKVEIKFTVVSACYKNLQELENDIELQTRARLLVLRPKLS